MSPRHQVTITLGRSGQVVKRTGPATDSEFTPSSEGKRPIRERLGNNTDNSYSYVSQDRNKRQRIEDSNWSSGDKQYTSNLPVDRHDLRFKLVNKSLSRRTNAVAQEQHKVDLREKLSRSTQVPVRSDARDHAPGSRNPGLTRKIPPTRSADDLLQLDSLRKSYSSWSLSGLRHRSPDRLLGASRGISPPRSYNDLRHVPSSRSSDASRPTSYMRNGVVDATRPTAYVGRPATVVEAAKPVIRVPPRADIIQKRSYMLEEPLTVASLLNSLGLGKYGILFQVEEIDMAALKQMGDNDLKELGIPMGPRKKILLAVLSHSKHRHI